MRTETIKLYKFEELNSETQEKVLRDNYSILVDYDWWDFVYMDAENVGVKIEGFDIDRAAYVNATFIESAEAAAHKIMDEHGENCSTYAAAREYLTERDKLIEDAERDENGDFVDEWELDADLDELDAEFLKSLQECFLSLLRDEFDYLSSEENLKEHFTANNYEFTERGKIWR